MVISKVLALEPEIILLDEPTRGVDVGAKSEIYRIIDGLAKEGKAILLISSEMNELLAMADRVLVMHEGTLAGEFSRAEFSAEKIAAAAAGIGFRSPTTQIERDSGHHKMAPSRPRQARYLERLATSTQAPPLIFLVVLLGLLSVSTPGFSSIANFRSIIDQVAVVGIVALAVNMVILSGRDRCFRRIAFGGLRLHLRQPCHFSGELVCPWGRVFIGGAVLGAVNGFIVTRGRVPSIIATLGMLLALRGAHPALRRKSGDQPFTRVAEFLVWVAFGVSAYLLGSSSWGLSCFGCSDVTPPGAGRYSRLGETVRAAHLAGLPVSAVKLGCFIVSGAACGRGGCRFPSAKSANYKPRPPPDLSCGSSRLSS